MENRALVDRSAISFVDYHHRGAAGRHTTGGGRSVNIRVQRHPATQWHGLLVKALYEGAVDATYVTGPAAELESVLNARVVFDASRQPVGSTASTDALLKRPV
ncbi:hypothetical protein NKH73_20050 [Mesorhizobium sp. M0938]|uniref:hypothetical protein n=1 Tax=unclassified Mesorhizobium TaxID=325217 RepID=UPI00333D08FB